MITRKKFFKLAIIFAVLCAVFFVLNYFCYHYTDDSNSDQPGEGRFFFTSYHEDCRKPFITDLLGQMGCFWLFAAVTCLLIATVVIDKDKKDEIQAPVFNEDDSDDIEPVSENTESKEE